MVVDEYNENEYVNYKMLLYTATVCWAVLSHEYSLTFLSPLRVRSEFRPSDTAISNAVIKSSTCAGSKVDWAVSHDFNC